MAEDTQADVEALRRNESLRRRLVGLAKIADDLDPEDGNAVADKAWIFATIDEVVDERDILLARLAAQEAALDVAEKALTKLERRNYTGTWREIEELHRRDAVAALDEMARSLDSGDGA